MLYYVQGKRFITENKDIYLFKAICEPNARSVTLKETLKMMINNMFLAQTIMAQMNATQVILAHMNMAQTTVAHIVVAQITVAQITVTQMKRLI